MASLLAHSAAGLPPTEVEGIEAFLGWLSRINDNDEIDLEQSPNTVFVLYFASTRSTSASLPSNCSRGSQPSSSAAEKLQPRQHASEFARAQVTQRFTRLTLVGKRKQVSFMLDQAGRHL